MLLNRTLGRDLLPPLLVTFGLSIIIQNGLLQAFSADSQRLRSGAIETASIPLGGGIAVGVVPLLTLLSAIAVIVLLNLIFYRTPIGRAFRATSDDLEVAQLMGIDISRIFAIAMGLAFVVIAIAALYLGLRANFDPTIGPGAAALCLRGRDHRRPRQLLGHARRRHRARARPDHRRAHRSGMADPGGPSRLPRGAGAAAARPVSARAGLRMR